MPIPTGHSLFQCPEPIGCLSAVSAGPVGPGVAGEPPGGLQVPAGRVAPARGVAPAPPGGVRPAQPVNHTANHGTQTPPAATLREAFHEKNVAQI